MRIHRTTRWRPRTWEVLLLLFLLATLTAEVGFAVGTLRPSASEAASSTPPVASAAGGAASGGPSGTPVGPSSGAPEPTLGATGTPLSQLIGQKLMVAMDGTTPSAALLGRIQRGEIGGVILFSFNIVSAAQVQALSKELQAAAAAGGRPPLLISTDQEGGEVKRIPWSPPTLSPPAMGQLGSAATAQEQGLETGYVLRCAGINNDLAPVADVPSSTASFMYENGRTWSFDAGATATLSDAFATGLEAGGDVPAMKHFPGLGYAAENTDDEVVTIAASKAELAPGLLPYQAAIGHGIPMIMLSNATYPAYDSVNAAGWSKAIGVDLLRGTLGFQGVTITDSLSGTASSRGVSATSLARKAAKAGTDMLLLTGKEAGSARAYARLLEDAQDGAIPADTLQASYDRIVALKATLHAPVADAAPPDVAAPKSRLYAPSTLVDGAVPVRTAWSASDPCAVSAYGLRRRTGDSSWVGLGLPSTPSTSIKQSLSPGTTYRYGVVAADGAGNWSDATKGSRFVPKLVESKTADVTFSGAWTPVNDDRFSGGGTRSSTEAGASASYTFTGTSIGWVAALGPTRGSADVYLDGELRQTVDLHAGTVSRQEVVFVASWPSQGEHTIQVVVKGTTGHPRVDVDAFVQLELP
jgi:beta-N-acetylhexosaminidase